METDGSSSSSDSTKYSKGMPESSWALPRWAGSLHRHAALTKACFGLQLLMGMPEAELLGHPACCCYFRMLFLGAWTLIWLSNPVACWYTSLFGEWDHMQSSPQANTLFCARMLRNVCWSVANLVSYRLHSQNFQAMPVLALHGEEASAPCTPMAFIWRRRVSPWTVKKLVCVTAAFSVMIVMTVCSPFLLAPIASRRHPGHHIYDGLSTISSAWNLCWISSFWVVCIIAAEEVVELEDTVDRACREPPEVSMYELGQRVHKLQSDWLANGSGLLTHWLEVCAVQVASKLLFILVDFFIIGNMEGERWETITDFHWVSAVITRVIICTLGVTMVSLPPLYFSSKCSALVEKLNSCLLAVDRDVSECSSCSFSCSKSLASSSLRPADTSVYLDLQRSLNICRFATELNQGQGLGPAIFGLKFDAMRAKTVLMAVSSAAAAFLPGILEYYAGIEDVLFRHG